jgi:hypothetical protein
MLTILANLILGNTRRTMQANVFTSRTNFKLVFTLNAEITFGADTVFPEAMGLIELLEFFAKLLKQFAISCPRTAMAAILTLQTTLFSSLIRAVLTKRSMEALWAIAPLVPEVMKDEHS